MKFGRNFTNLYELIFGKQKEIEMNGALETGLGEGGYYISKKGYMTQFEKKLGWKPFEGTFNLRLKEEEVPKIEAMKAADGITSIVESSVAQKAMRLDRFGHTSVSLAGSEWKPTAAIKRAMGKSESERDPKIFVRLSIDAMGPRGTVI